MTWISQLQQQLQQWIDRHAPWLKKLRFPAVHIAPVHIKPKTRNWIVGGALTFALLSTAIVGYFYFSYARLIDQKLGRGPVGTNSTLYAAPHRIAVNDVISIRDLTIHLQRSGYREDGASRVGTFKRSASSVQITTGPDSYYGPHSATIFFNKSKVFRITSHTNGANVAEYSLEPEVITALYDSTREKRRPVRFAEIPQHLIDALISVEDKRFFQHHGLDVLRVAKAAYVDVKEGRMEQGASTLTMQLARSFFLDQEKTWKRKFAEVLMTVELERRFTKQQILELYVNEVYLGRSSSFSIHGFGEAAHAYFGKDIRKLTLPEAATLAGLIQRPAYYNPFRYEERIRERRDLVLSMMHGNDLITSQQVEAARRTPVELNPAELESTDAPYFVGLVSNELQTRFKDRNFAQNSFRVYSTLDRDLQREAVAAIREGMAEVDTTLRNKRGKKKTGPFPQVALIALDPKTGEVRALVGGRGYEQSQLNRALALRQPGSSFKPFVYAAALNTALQKKAEVITPATMLVDEPTTFMFRQQKYEPGNFHNQFYGDVTLRRALTKSMNIPTVKIAEHVGYGAIVELARGAGITSPLHATPSIALGSYETTPLEIAEAYTIFANRGIHVSRSVIQSIRDGKNQPVYSHQPDPKAVLDPRIAYMMVNMMEDVLNSGTGAAVRSKGFRAPAAGKTGTSRDGWFAGFTSELICVVWVGYDDNHELEIEGAKSALPVWTEFMKRAHGLRQYRGAKPFQAPRGLVSETIDPETGALATEACYETKLEIFIAGTEPVERCYLHEGGEPLQEAEGKARRRGVFGRIADIFR